MTAIAIVATEGYGSIPMTTEAFVFLKKFDGKRVSVLTTTRLNGFLARPQIIHVNEDALDDEAPAVPLTLGANTRVRVVDQSGLGTTGVVAEKPKRVRRADGIAVDVMSVLTADGKTRTVAANNVEIIA